MVKTILIILDNSQSEFINSWSEFVDQCTWLNQFVDSSQNLLISLYHIVKKVDCGRLLDNFNW